MARTNTVSQGLTHGVSTNVIIDYNTRNGTKQWTKATRKLEDEFYDGDTNSLHRLLDMAKRAKFAVWKTICSMNGTNLQGEYRAITVKECEDHGEKYFELDFNGKLLLKHEGKLLQQMYICIKQSTTKACVLKVSTSGIKPNIAITKGIH